MRLLMPGPTSAEVVGRTDVVAVFAGDAVGGRWKGLTGGTRGPGCQLPAAGLVRGALFRGLPAATAPVA